MRRTVLTGIELMQNATLGSEPTPMFDLGGPMEHMFEEVCI
jgi:hypothetical protein